MKDYSEFIRDDYGFITSINPILETKTIEVYTSKSKKDRPHIYELNRENIKKLYGRLEKQWNLLIENKDLVLKQLQEKRDKKFKIVEIGGISTSVILLLIAFFVPELNILFALGLIPGVGSILSTITARSKFRKSFEEMIETYNYFITHKEEIEALAKTDENVTRDITVNTYQKLKKSNKLLEENLTDEQYTIQLIDSLPLKDLKEMSLRYKISKALDSEPYFYEVNPEEIMGEAVTIEEQYDIPNIDNDQIKNQHSKKTLHK